MTQNNQNMLKYAIPLFLLMLMLGGVGFLYYGEFTTKQEKNIEIWYVEEIINPYTGVGTVIQVTYRDILGDRVLIFYKNDLSSSLSSGEYSIEYEVRDKLLRRSKPLTLVKAVKLN